MGFGGQVKDLENDLKTLENKVNMLFHRGQL